MTDYGMRWGLRVIALTLPLGALPPVLHAQAVGTDCDVVSFRVWESESFGPGQRITWFGRPVLDCPGGTRIQADSAVIYEANGRTELIGQVLVREPERELRAQSADYYQREGRLLARGAVVYLDLVGGTEFQGENLVYLEPTDFRPQPQFTITGAPARARLPAGEAEPGEPEREPYLVSGLQLRVEDGRFFWADGEVEVLRDELRTSSSSLAFDQQQGNVTLTGSARVELRETELEGNRINLFLPEDRLREVHAHERARIVSGDQELRAGEIRIEFEEDEIDYLVAVHREPTTGEPDPIRPHAITSGFLLVGDSIELAPSAESEERMVEAVGVAWAEEHPADAPAPDLSVTPSERAVGPVESLERDWIQGDHIVAIFAPAAGPEERMDQDVPPPPGAETTEGFRPIYLQASGSAATFYRSPPQGEEPDGPVDGSRNRAGWGISYLLADEIRIHFLMAGEVDRVEARGNVSGVQIEPATGPDATGGQVLQEEDRE